MEQVGAGALEVGVPGLRAKSEWIWGAQHPEAQAPVVTATSRKAMRNQVTATSTGGTEARGRAWGAACTGHMGTAGGEHGRGNPQGRGGPGARASGERTDREGQGLVRTDKGKWPKAEVSSKERMGHTEGWTPCVGPGRQASPLSTIMRGGPGVGLGREGDGTGALATQRVLPPTTCLYKIYFS